MEWNSWKEHWDFLQKKKDSCPSQLRAEETFRIFCSLAIYDTPTGTQHASAFRHTVEEWMQAVRAADTSLQSSKNPNHWLSPSRIFDAAKQDFSEAIWPQGSKRPPLSKEEEAYFFEAMRSKSVKIAWINAFPTARFPQIEDHGYPKSEIAQNDQKWASGLLKQWNCDPDLQGRLLLLESLACVAQENPDWKANEIWKKTFEEQKKALFNLTTNNSDLKENLNKIFNNESVSSFDELRAKMKNLPTPHESIQAQEEQKADARLDFLRKNALFFLSRESGIQYPGENSFVSREKSKEWEDGFLNACRVANQMIENLPNSTIKRQSASWGSLTHTLRSAWKQMPEGQKKEESYSLIENITERKKMAIREDHSMQP